MGRGSTGRDMPGSGQFAGRSRACYYETIFLLWCHTLYTKMPSKVREGLNKANKLKKGFRYNGEKDEHGRARIVRSAASSNVKRPRKKTGCPATSKCACPGAACSVRPLRCTGITKCRCPKQHPCACPMTRCRLHHGACDGVTKCPKRKKKKR